MPEGMARDLTAAALHRMSQPLTVLRGTAELALTRPLDPQQFRETLLTMARETERLVALAEALRALNAPPAPDRSGAASGSWPLSRLHAELAPLAAAKGIPVTSAVEPRTGRAPAAKPAAELVGSWFEPVVALAHLALDRARARLEIRLLGNGLAIADDGAPLDAAAWARAFDPFAAGADIPAALRAALARRQLAASGAALSFGPGPSGENHMTVRSA